MRTRFAHILSKSSIATKSKKLAERLITNQGAVAAVVEQYLKHINGMLLEINHLYTYLRWRVVLVVLIMILFS